MQMQSLVRTSVEDELHSPQGSSPDCAQTDVTVVRSLCLVFVLYSAQKVITSAGVYETLLRGGHPTTVLFAPFGACVNAVKSMYLVKTPKTPNLRSTGLPIAIAGSACSVHPLSMLVLN